MKWCKTTLGQGIFFSILSPPYWSTLLEQVDFIIFAVRNDTIKTQKINVFHLVFYIPNRKNPSTNCKYNVGKIIIPWKGCNLGIMTPTPPFVFAVWNYVHTHKMMFLQIFDGSNIIYGTSIWRTYIRSDHHLFQTTVPHQPG